MTGNHNLAATSLWRSLIAVIATSMAFSGLLVAFNASPAHAAGTTVVSLTFDDGSADQLEAAQYLQSKGMKGTFFVNSGTLGDSTFLSRADVVNIQGMGHEIGGHTVNHAEFAVEGTANAQSEICGDRSTLNTLLGRQITSFAWPFAYYTAALEQVAKGCGYTSARGLGDVKLPWVTCNEANAYCATGETFTNQADPFFTKAPPQVERTWNEANLESLVNQAVDSTTSGKWLQLTFHHLCQSMADCPNTPENPDTDVNPAYSMADFKTFIDWLATQSANGSVIIKTVGDVVAGKPGAPTAVNAVSGNGSAAVSWTAPDNGGSAISGYTVTAAPGGSTCSPVPATGTSCTVTGLTNGTSYTFTVAARNSRGTGPASVASAAVVPLGPPGVPTSVEAEGGNSAATVTWRTPATDGGTPVTDYTVTSSPAGSTCTTKGELTCTVSGLTNGQKYTFQVKATNKVGDGLLSDASAEVTPATVPDAPSSATAEAGDRTATVSWTVPSTDGGSPITGYKVSSSPGDKTCSTTDALSCTVEGLSNGTTYTFQVSATNAKGDGASKTTSPVGPAGVPGAPSSVKAVADNGSAKVSWKAADDNGSRITAYTVKSSPGGKTCKTTGGLSCTVSGLNNGTNYVFRVVATNAKGDGAESKASAPVGPASVPGAPSSVKAVAGNSTATVSWKAPATTGGSAITGYKVTSSPGGKTCSTTGSRSCTVRGLSNGTSYTFRVVARNAKGDGAASSASNRVKPAAAVKIKVAKAGFGDVLAVDVDPNRSRGSYLFRVERKSASGTWSTVGRYRTAGAAQTKSVTLGAGVYRVAVPEQEGYAAATSAVVRLTAPTVKVKLSTNAAKSKLLVDVDPNGRGSWAFKVQKRRADGSWATLSTTYRTSGRGATASVDQGKGTYRVVVVGKGSYVGAASATATLRS